MSEIVFTPSVLKHAPWSISKVGVLDLCAKQYLLKYVLKEKETKKSTKAKVGTALHSALEYMLKDATLNLDKVFKVCAEKEQLSKDEEIEAIAKLPALEGFMSRITGFKAKVGAQRELIEHRMAILPNFEKAEFFEKGALLRGVVDYGLITNDNVLIIIDHKSGKKKPIQEHNTQFFSYMLMAIAHFNVKAVQCAINYIGTDKLDWAKHDDGSNRAWTRSEITNKLKPWLGVYLNSVSNTLDKVEVGEACPETGWQCEYCGFSDRCDAGQLELDRRKRKRGDFSEESI